MKKILSTVFAMAIMIVAFATTGFSQSITLEWNIPTMQNGSGSTLSPLSAIMVVYQDISAPNPGLDITTPYFLTGNDKVVPFQGMWAGYNPLPYNPGFATGFKDINVAHSITNFEEGHVYKMYVRVFDNIAYNAFGQDGTWDGTFMDGGNKSNYYESAPQTVMARADTENIVEFVLSTPGETMQMLMPNSGQLPTGEPVPEPSAMFLAAIGVAWLRRRIKKV